MADSLQSLNTLDLGSVCGAKGKPGFNAGLCFDNSWPWALGGSGLFGPIAGPIIGAAAGAATSPACGNGKQSPATMLRNALFAPSKPAPFENARFGPIFKK